MVDGNASCVVLASPLAIIQIDALPVGMFIVVNLFGVRSVPAAHLRVWLKPTAWTVAIRLQTGKLVCRAGGFLVGCCWRDRSFHWRMAGPDGDLGIGRGWCITLRIGAQCPVPIISGSVAMRTHNIRAFRVHDAPSISFGGVIETNTHLIAIPRLFTALSALLQGADLHVWPLGTSIHDLAVWVGMPTGMHVERIIPPRRTSASRCSKWAGS